MKAPVSTSFTAGWAAARKAVRAGIVREEMSNERIRYVAAEQARGYMKKTMETRPRLTQRAGVLVFDAFFKAFIDSSIEEQFHRQSFVDFYGR
jgi:hypothetical protein